jgi:hypothetical protein
MKRCCALTAILFVSLPLSGAEKEEKKKDPPVAKVTTSGKMKTLNQIHTENENTTAITLLENPEDLQIVLHGSLSRTEILKVARDGVTAEGIIRPEGKKVVLEGSVRGRDEKEKDKNLAKGQAIVEGELMKADKGGVVIANSKWPITIISNAAIKVAETSGKVRVTGKLRLTEKGGLEVVAERVEEVKEKKEQ